MYKLIIELGPLIALLMTFKSSDIVRASGIMVAVSIICLGISYIIDRKISVPLAISTLLIVIFGSITFFSGDSTYIKMKPTIGYVIFALGLSIGLFFNKFFLKHVLHSIFKMEDQYWVILTKRFIWFFILLAILNEIVWRNFSDNFWVNFKVFGVFPITFLFILVQIPLFKQHVKIDS